MESEETLMTQEPSQEELLAAVLVADEEGLNAGEDPAQRTTTTILRVMKNLGMEGCTFAGPGTDPLIDRVHDLIRKLYRPEDIAVGGMHLGVFMFRDIFARIGVPRGYGIFPVDPFTHTNLTPIQLRWLQSRPEDLKAFLDQFADIWDFGWGARELGRTRPANSDCSNFLNLARFHLQAAAAVATGAFDLGGAVQSSLIATELMLKGGLAANGLSQSALKNLGHDLTALAAELSKHETRFDRKRVVATVGQFPKYVPNRYSSSQPDRRSTGHIVMGAQYIAGEVVRQLTDRDFRAIAANYPARSYPPLPP